jgi:flagellin-like protein
MSKILYIVKKLHYLRAGTPRRRQNNMNRYRKNDKAVSPVIATILMVAITVVLAGVLVVYLQTLPQGGGGAENPVGLSVIKNTSGNWLISVSSGGGQSLNDVTLSVTDPNTGAKIISVKLATAGTVINAPATATYNDNDLNVKINSGDSFVVYSATNGAVTPGTCAAGQKVQLLKGESVIGTIKELPS